MKSRGALQIDPGFLETPTVSGDLEVVVPYTEAAVTGAVLERAMSLTAGLNARLTLLAIHAVPYPLPFERQTALHTHLVEQLTALASRWPSPISAQVVLARSSEEGYRYFLKPESTILVGTRRHFWRTREEKLARTLAREGHKVALLHIA